MKLELRGIALVFSSRMTERRRSVHFPEEVLKTTEEEKDTRRKYQEAAICLATGKKRPKLEDVKAKSVENDAKSDNDIRGTCNTNAASNKPSVDKVEPVVTKETTKTPQNDDDSASSLSTNISSSNRNAKESTTPTVADVNVTGKLVQNKVHFVLTFIVL